MKRKRSGTTSLRRRLAAVLLPGAAARIPAAIAGETAALNRHVEILSCVGS